MKQGSYHEILRKYFEKEAGPIVQLLQCYFFSFATELVAKLALALHVDIARQKTLLVDEPLQVELIVSNQGIMKHKVKGAKLFDTTSQIHLN